ncbi:MAG: hypothetical protein ACK5WD_04480, partial [bacterium]
MTASPSVIRRARAVFQCALELEGAEREEFVRDACSGDEALLDFVHSLLAADLEEGSSFTFATDVVRPSVRHAADERPSSPLPEGFAHVRELGIGGSGRVVLCRDRS